MGTIKSIGILTSEVMLGMNAAIRAVTRSAIYNGLKVYGIYRGYKGLGNRWNSGIQKPKCQQHHTNGRYYPKTARCKEFTTPEGRAQAYENMKSTKSMLWSSSAVTVHWPAHVYLHKEFDVPCIGLPGTIDNDLYGTDTTIGYDTALNTILDAVDKIRGYRHLSRTSVLCRGNGTRCRFSGIERRYCLGQKQPSSPNSVRRWTNWKNSSNTDSASQKAAASCWWPKVNLPEGYALCRTCENEYPQYDVRVTILGHLQRGGRPTAHDRIIASPHGSSQHQALLEGQRNVMIGIDDDKIVYVPFVKAIKNDKPHRQRTGERASRTLHLKR